MGTCHFVLFTTAYQQSCLAQRQLCPRMAPHLAESQHILVHNMITSKTPFKAKQIAKGAVCSRQTIQRMRTNIRKFGSTRAPPNRVGRPRSITPAMLDALCEHLQKNPELYQEEMVLFLWEKFKVHVTTSSVARAQNSIGWSKKKICRVARGQNADLRYLYMYNISGFSSY